MPLSNPLLCILLFIAILGPFQGYSISPFFGTHTDSLKVINAERAKAHAEVLLSLQRKTNHLWRRAGWWNSANILESLIDYHRISGTDFSKELKTIYRRNLYRLEVKYISPISFDDNEWWALTWLKAYDMTGDKHYLAISENIQRDMVRRAWDTTVCGAGMKWRTPGHYKNAVTNELFLVLSARLALETKDSAKKQYYLGWALKEWAWFKNSGILVTDSAWVSDGLDKECKTIYSRGLDLTYNQGIILGGLTYLYQLTHDMQYLKLAQKLAHGSMKKFVSNIGVLSEYDGPNHDKIQFKGIYIRYLAILNTELHDKEITAFIQHNADHVWQHCRSSDGLCDYDWNGPYTDWTSSAMGSVMDLMNAAMMQDQQLK